MKQVNYTVGSNESGHVIFKAVFDWTDDKGNSHSITTDDPETAETVAELLTGNITLGDLLD